MKSLEAEQSVIGTILLLGSEAAEAIYRLNRIGVNLFTDEVCKSAYRAIQELSGKQIDIVIVGNQMNATPDIRAQLTAMAEHAPNLNNLASYISILEEHYKRRKLSDLSVNMAYQLDDGASPVEVVGYTQSQLLSLVTPENQQLTLSQSLKATLGQIEDRFNSDEMFGVPTGFNFLDSRLDGLQTEELTVISGNPGSGKTTLAMQIALAASQKKPVAFFSMEMGHHQLNKRMISNLGSVSISRIMSGSLLQDDWPKLTSAAVKLKQLEGKIFIDYEVGIDSEYIRLKANEIKMKAGGLGLLIVDYHTIMAQRKRETRLDATTRNAMELNRLKKELGCHVLVIAQLNKDVVKSGKQPNQGDLDYGQQLQKDADNMWFLYVNDGMKEKQVVKFYSDKARSSEPFNTYLENELHYNRFGGEAFYNEQDNVTSLGFKQ